MRHPRDRAGAALLALVLVCAQALLHAEPPPVSAAPESLDAGRVVAALLSHPAVEMVFLPRRGLYEAHSRSGLLKFLRVPGDGGFSYERIDQKDADPRSPLSPRAPRPRADGPAAGGSARGGAAGWSLPDDRLRPRVGSRSGAGRPEADGRPRGSPRRDGNPVPAHREPVSGEVLYAPGETEARFRPFELLEPGAGYEVRARSGDATASARFRVRSEARAVLVPAGKMALTIEGFDSPGALAVLLNGVKGTLGPLEVDLSGRGAAPVRRAGRHFRSGPAAATITFLTLPVPPPLSSTCSAPLGMARRRSRAP